GADADDGRDGVSMIILSISDDGLDGGSGVLSQGFGNFIRESSLYNIDSPDKTHRIDDDDQEGWQGQNRIVGQSRCETEWILCIPFFISLYQKAGQVLEFKFSRIEIIFSHKEWWIIKKVSWLLLFSIFDLNVKINNRKTNQAQVNYSLIRTD